MSKRKPKVIEPEVLPAVKVKQDEHATRVADLHLAAEQHASMAVYCAAVAGAVMLQKKKLLGHGRGFQKWKSELVLADGRRICVRTAEKYMALTKQMVAHIKILQKSPESNTHLRAYLTDGAEGTLEVMARFDPTKVKQFQRAAVAQAMKQVANEQTLQQLYFAWGITKEPGKLGGHHPRKGPAPSKEDILAAEKKAARLSWAEHAVFLEEKGTKKCTWGHLSKTEREGLADLLDEISGKIKASLVTRVGGKK